MLVAVHVAIAAHVAHWLLAGRTVSPVEPSESMYTLELGQLNAGFVFFAVALAATLVFGRFVCGWACHLVALQDACAWLLGRFGLKPKPLRSRLLAFAPAAVAFYMFFWPTLRRLVEGRPHPGFTPHFTTASFWATFPGPVMAVLTLAVCGFAAVWFLGSKGFCTYGCPYGALFGVVDRFSPARIVVSDACAGCGQCTATCTSNVLVHDEVRRYGRVVDPGCMKCLDCVSVCPNGALSYGFAKPAVFGALPRLPGGRASSPPEKTTRQDHPTRHDQSTRRYPLTWTEEFAIALSAVVATLAFRGLYDGPPLLLAIALGGITAAVVLALLRLARGRDTVRLQSLTLRAGGAWTRAGRLVALLGVAWLLFVAHSAAVQWDRARGRVWLARTEVSRADALSGAFRTRILPASHEAAVAAAQTHFARADRLGLRGVPEIKLGLAYLALLRDDVDGAVRALREAIALTPREPQQYENLVDVLTARGRTAEAIDALKTKLAVLPSPTDWFRLGSLHADAGRYDDARAAFEAGLALDPTSGPARFNLGGVLRRAGRAREAVTELERAARSMPADFDTHVELGLALRDAGRPADALTALRRAISLAPDHPEAKLHLPGVIAEIEASAPRPVAVDTR